MRITTHDAGGETVTTLSGELQDQAELSGILNTLYELHLTLLLVERVDDEQPAAPK